MSTNGRAPLAALTIGLWLGGCASLPRDRSSAPAEAEALRAVRCFVGAEFSYATANYGYYDEPACLERPWKCIPGWREADGDFLRQSGCGPLPRSYVFRFHGGFPPPWGEGSQYSPTSRYSFAYTAVPASRAPELRSFCGDSTGFVCATPGSEPPRVRVSECPADCREVR